MKVNTAGYKKLYTVTLSYNPRLFFAKRFYNLSHLALSIHLLFILELYSNYNRS